MKAKKLRKHPSVEEVIAWSSFDETHIVDWVEVNASQYEVRMWDGVKKYRYYYLYIAMGDGYVCRIYLNSRKRWAYEFWK